MQGSANQGVGLGSLRPVGIDGVCGDDVLDDWTGIGGQVRILNGREGEGRLGCDICGQNLLAALEDEMCDM